MVKQNPDTWVCRCGNPATRDKYGVLVCRNCRKDKDRIETKRLKSEENKKIWRDLGIDYP